MEIITVNKGETVYSISEAYSLNPEKIIADNGLDESGTLVVGQSLILLFPDETLIFENNTTVQEASIISQTSEKSIFRNNYFLNGNPIISLESEIVTKYKIPPKDSFFLGGYAYDFINDTLINSVISYLTYIIPFTYGFTENGDLIYPDDQRLLEKANSYSVLPLMHLSTLTAEGYFSNQLANSLLNNETAINNLYNNILENIREKGYIGIDVDFEFIFASDREPYISFIQGLTKLMNENGLLCFVALPPKTSDNQRGLLYEGIDYEGLGNAANFAFLMTYEWGYKYGEPQAVSPINKVREVVEYALTRIPKEKLILGISNYGYDWTLPFIRNESEAISISTVKAVDLAKKYGSEIYFDNTALSPYFNYTDENGSEHIVWYEDARSFAGKVDLMREYDLAGGFIWDLMRENPSGFVTLNALIKIK